MAFDSTHWHRDETSADDFALGLTASFTCPLTTGVFQEPQLTSQPVSSIFLCYPLPSQTWWTPGLSFPDVVFLPLFLCALSSSPFQCALQDGLTSENWKSSHSVSTGSQTHASCFYRNVAPLQADRDLPSKNLHRRSPTPTPSSLTDSWLTSMAVVLVMWCFCFTELPAQGADWWADVKLDLLGLTIAPHTYTDMNCALGIALTVQSWMQRGKNHFDI